MQQGAGEDGRRGARWLRHEPELGVAVCPVHGYAVANVERHLRDRHKDLDRAERQEIAGSFAQSGLAAPDKSQLRRYGATSPREPIDGLPVQRGYHCLSTSAEGGCCDFRTPSRKCLRVHGNKVHGTTMSRQQGRRRRRPAPQQQQPGGHDNDDGEEGEAPTVWLQTLFTGPKSAIYYFCVTGPQAGAGAAREEGEGGEAGGTWGVEHTIARVTEQWQDDRAEQEELMKVLTAAAAQYETTNWLKRAGWTAHFEGRDLGSIYTSSLLPKADDDGQRVLVAAVDRLFFDRCVGGLDNMPLMTRLQLASPHLGDAHSRPFGPLQDKKSMAKYLRYWKRFLCYCLNVLHLSGDELQARHGFVFTGDQRRGLEGLRDRLRRGAGSSDSSDSSSGGDDSDDGDDDDPTGTGSSSGWVPCMVATAALGTGIDVGRITLIIHIGAPYSIIDQAQETGRGGRAGEAIQAVTLVEDREWPPDEQEARTTTTASRPMGVEAREVGWLVRTRGCRRRVLGLYLDGNPRDCRAIEGAVACDNCETEAKAEAARVGEPAGQGIEALTAYGQETARGLEQLEAALTEVEGLGSGPHSPGCRSCWVFEGAQAASTHGWYGCAEAEDTLRFASCMRFQGLIDYRKDKRARFLSCFHCHVSQKLCTDGHADGGRSCRWKHIVVPVAWTACHDDELWERVQWQLAGRQIVGEKDYAAWLGQQHRRPVHGQVMTNAMAVFGLEVEWRARAGSFGPARLVQRAA